MSTGRPGPQRKLSLWSGLRARGGGLCLGWKGAQRQAWALWAGLTRPGLHFQGGDTVSLGPKGRGAGSTPTGHAHCAQLPIGRPPPILHRGPQPPPPAGERYYSWL